MSDEEREIGGYNVTVDWPRLEPSLLIATALVLAIRTSKRPATLDNTTANPELDRRSNMLPTLAVG